VHIRTEEVRRFFEKFGEVRDVYLPLDYRSRRPRGFGFIEFTSNEEAKEALDKGNG
jgi:RNA recognition motif-containing protein